ncbi:hypothetical protein BD289DRAFT_366514 [Coniella lustricola]|uniref:Uncharacterized protein n=1 Tax=Coniella lustricola TaxID=2025994 RepID=A0A2T3AAW4_9PEZI|nr:hypothetical protein BD289DRAFT_366514 [Coniella lustricola]
MCQVRVYENPYCRCRWLQIHKQCRSNAGFSQCEQFGKTRVKFNPEEHECSRCPVHDLDGWYDRNFIRMCPQTTRGFRLGLGPSRRDPGIDCCCAVM